MPWTECTPYTRHARVWLDAATWRSRLVSCDGGPASRADRADVESIAAWVARGRALVVRRRDPDQNRPLDESTACCLGIALPLAAGRRRLAIVVERAAVVRVAPPLSLGEVIAHAPSTRRAALADLQQAAVALDTPLHVYGSYAWQAISGEPCVTPASDIDLLWDVRDGHHARRVIDALGRWEAASGMRADGEARFENGDAVAWRELASAARHVLVKRDDGVALVATEVLFAPSVASCSVVHDAPMPVTGRRAS